SRQHSAQFLPVSCLVSNLLFSRHPSVARELGDHHVNLCPVRPRQTRYLQELLFLDRSILPVCHKIHDSFFVSVLLFPNLLPKHPTTLKSLLFPDKTPGGCWFDPMDFCRPVFEGNRPIVRMLLDQDGELFSTVHER